MSKLDLTQSIDELSWEDDPFFRGWGRQSRQTAYVGTFELESWTDADGNTSEIFIYAKAAIGRAAARSIAKGAGVLGLCSKQLPKSEYRPVPEGSTIGGAMSIAKGLR